METSKQKIATKHIQPKILYYGTPVILLSTLNEDGTVNISPLSSSWALGNCVVLGIGLESKAIENLQRHQECVINVPSPDLWGNVEKLAPYTGKQQVPEWKLPVGFSYYKDKYEAGELTPIESFAVQPTRIAECPIQIEAQVRHIRIPEHTSFMAIVETEAVHVHAHQHIRIDDNHIDPRKWSPLIYNFRHYFGLSAELGKTYRAET
ncbi:flavin reductase family protein [Paenibacillus sp.]|uniref:flavin reductase family protein n=1 Tax=Paenibacillus sp. TaxID=58172 RepID=UPI003463ECAC